MSHEQPALPAPPEGIEFVVCESTSQSSAEVYTFIGRPEGRRTLYNFRAHTVAVPPLIGLRVSRNVQSGGGGYWAPGWGRLFPGVACCDGTFTAFHSTVWLISSEHAKAIVAACIQDEGDGSFDNMRDGKRALEVIAHCRANIDPAIAASAMEYAKAVNAATYARQEEAEANHCRDWAVTGVLSMDLISKEDEEWLRAERSRQYESQRLEDLPRLDRYRDLLAKEYRAYLSGVEVLPTPPPDGFDPFERIDRRADARSAKAKEINDAHKDTIQEISRRALEATRRAATRGLWYLNPA